MNVVNVEYDEIKSISLTDAYNYNFTNTGSSYPIALSFNSKMLLNLINDNVSTDSGTVVVMLDKDLKYKQKIDIIVKPEYALYSQSLSVTMMYKYNDILTELQIFEVSLPKDLDTYNILVPETSTFNDSYYLNENIYTNSTSFFTGSSWCTTGYTQIVLTEDIFKSGNTIYVQNLYFKTPNGDVVDFSGAYSILCKTGTTLTIDLLSADVSGYILLGQPRISFYRGLQVSILRTYQGDDVIDFNKKYDITYKII
jgi:hypothetical protein